MARHARCAKAGFVYHVLNRGNRRQRIFNDRADYLTFTQLLAETASALAMRVCAYCLMPNHWHLVVWPTEDAQLSAFMFQLTNAHVARHRTMHGTTGTGHLYQGRFRSFPVQSDDHYLRVMRYVEANALRAALVQCAESWPWSSMTERVADAREIITPGPLGLPTDWVTYVNATTGTDELECIRNCNRQGRPYGSPDWMLDTAALHRLALRGRGRPRRGAR